MQSLKNAPQLHLVWISAKHEAEAVSGFHGSRLTPCVKINIILFSKFSAQIRFIHTLGHYWKLREVCVTNPVQAQRSICQLVQHFAKVATCQSQQ